MALRKINDEFFKINDDTTICKYMDFAKLMSLLQFSSLHFTRADNFQDIYEGKIPEFFFKGWTEENRKNYEKVYLYHRKQRGKTFISSWNMFDKESYAMWQIYGENYGIAIETKVGKLKKSLKSDKINIYKVQYIDYRDKNQSKLIPLYWDDNEEAFKRNFFIYKSKSYEYEKEVRAIIVEETEADFKGIDVDINQLIDKIYISPFVETWFVDLVEEIIHKQYGLMDKKIIMSDIEIKKI